MKKQELLTVYAIGSVGYRFIEVLWRGRTHWTMGILGGACFLIMYVTEAAHRHMRLACRALISSLCVTTVEFFSGLLISSNSNRIITWRSFFGSACSALACGITPACALIFAGRFRSSTVFSGISYV